MSPTLTFSYGSKGYLQLDTGLSSVPNIMENLNAKIPLLAIVISCVPLLLCTLLP